MCAVSVIEVELSWTSGWSVSHPLGGGCSCMCCRYSLSLGVLLYHVSHHIRKNSFYQYFNCMVHFYKLVVNENVYKFDRFLTRLLHLEVNLFFLHQNRILGTTFREDY